MPEVTYHDDLAADEYVFTCDVCGQQVNMFTLNAAGKSSCAPCGHPASVSLRPRPQADPDAAA